MLLKNNNHNHFEPVEKQHYKKSYLMRKIQEQEAEEEVESYDPERDSEDSQQPQMP